MSALKLASLAEFCWKQVVTFCSGVPRRPSCTEGRKEEKLGARFTSAHASSPVSSLLQYREVSPHTSGTGTAPRTASLPCKPTAAPAGMKESVRAALASQLPSGAGLRRQRNREARRHLFTAPSNTNATRQEGAGDLSPRGEGREEMETRQEPPTTSNWSLASVFAAVAPGRPSFCSAHHSSSHVQQR